MSGFADQEKGLVVHELGDGDHCWTVVDATLWMQIASIGETVSVEDRAEIIGWLCSPESDRPGAAVGVEPRGKVLRQFFTQRHVIEPEALDGVVGVLVLP